MNDIFNSGKAMTGKGHVRQPVTDPAKLKLLQKDLKDSRKILGTKTVDKNPLSPLRFYPDHADFINKDPQEKIILLIRKHPITNILWVVSLFLLIIAPAFLTVMPFYEAMPVGFQIMSVIIWYLGTFAFGFEKFLGWFLNVNIVTDERIFDVDFWHLVHREITEADIEKIQDVTVETNSPLRTVFNYGDVRIQTAAQVPQIEFQAIPQPDKVARVLRELRLEEEIERMEGRIR
jgi:membrane protein YdbS with pleckstrin-like domain